MRTCYSSVSVCLRAMSAVNLLYITVLHIMFIVDSSSRGKVCKRVTHTDALNTVVSEITKAINDNKNYGKIELASLNRRSSLM